MFLIGAPAFEEEKTYIFDGIIVRHGCKGYNDIKRHLPGHAISHEDYLTKHGAFRFLYRVYSIAVERVWH